MTENWKQELDSGSTPFESLNFYSGVFVWHRKGNTRLSVTNRKEEKRTSPGSEFMRATQRLPDNTWSCTNNKMPGAQMEDEFKKILSANYWHMKIDIHFHTEYSALLLILISHLDFKTFCLLIFYPSQIK